MMQQKTVRRLVIVVVIVAVLAAIVLTTRFIPPGQDVQTSQGLDPKTWAQQNYDSQVVPAITGKAAPWKDLIAAIESNLDSAGAKYGVKAEGANNYSFATTITGTVADDGDFGELGVHTDDTPSGVTVGFLIGPAITDSSLRDASGLLNFGMFVNQTAYQQASTELNNMVKQEVLAGFDSTGAIGKQYTVVGAFTWTGDGHVTITPVSLKAAS